MSWGRLLGISALWFGLQFFWTSQQLLVLPERLRAYVPLEYLGSYQGLIEGVGAVIVLLVQFSVGFLSDHASSRWGRRRPFIAWGFGLGLLAIVAFIFSPSFWPLFVSYLFIQLCLNFGTLPFQSLLPDLVPPRQHSAAGTAMGAMDLAGKLGGIISMLAATILIHGTLLVLGVEIPRAYLVFLLPAYIVAIALSVISVLRSADERRFARSQDIDTDPSSGGGFSRREDLEGRNAAAESAGLNGGRDGAATNAGPPLANLRLLPGVRIEFPRTAPALAGCILKSYLGVDLHGRMDFVWLAASRFFVYLGYFTFQNFVNYYTITSLDRVGFLRSLGLAPEAAAKYSGSVLPAMLLFFILGGIAGNILNAPLAARLGKKAVIGWGLGLASLFFIPLIFTQSVWAAIACGTVLGVGWGAFLAADWAFACTLMPPARSGTFMGLWCLTNLLPQVLAPVFSGPLRDLVFNLNKAALGEPAAEGLAYRVVFATVVPFFLTGMWLLRRVSESRGTPAAS